MVVLFSLIQTLQSNNRGRPCGKLCKIIDIKSIDIYWHKVYNGINIKGKDKMQPQDNINYEQKVHEQLDEIQKLIKEIIETMKG